MASSGLLWERVDGPRRLVRGAPIILLALAFVCALLVPVSTTAPGYAALLGLSVVAGAFSWWWTGCPALSSTARAAIYAFQVLLAAAMVALNPFYGIFGYFGYVSAMLLFDGGPLIGACFLNSFVMAASQIGGFANIGQSLGAFATLVLVNAGLSGAIVHYGTLHAREVEGREQAATELAEVSRRNQELHEQLMRRAHEQGIMQERERLSREIHDTVAQDLVAIVSQLEAIDPQGDWQPRVEAAKALARNGLAEARRAVSALRSPLLDEGTAADALRALLDQWSDHHRILARLQITGSPFPTQQDQVVVRVCQEALSNVARHSDAAEVVVHLEYTQDGLLLQIRDDGRGFSVDDADLGFGLRSMRERVEAVGGSLDVESAQGAGCSIDVAAPA